jgi:sugar lactone lactonase YvrE
MNLLILFLFIPVLTIAANVSTIYQFPNGTWVENLAEMRNGSILVTLIGKPEVHIVDPRTGSQNLVVAFPAANSVLGITELECDFFAVAVGTLKPTNEPIEGSFAIWSIDLRGECDAEVDKLVDLKNVSMVNGIAKLNPHTLLLADSWAGNIVSFNLDTKHYSAAFKQPSLAANFSSPQVPPLGVNGLRLHGKYLYYSNNVQSILGRIKLHHRSSTFELIATGEKVGGPDDLAVLRDGSVLLARPAADRIVHVGLDGKVGESVRVNGPTSVVLARGTEERVVYVSTCGLVGGLPREGGRVVRIEF